VHKVFKDSKVILVFRATLVLWVQLVRRVRKAILVFRDCKAILELKEFRV